MTFVALEPLVKAVHELAVGIVDRGERCLIADDHVGTEIEPGRPGFLLQPGECQIGQGIVPIATTDVRVRADKLALFDIEVLRFAQGPNRRAKSLRCSSMACA